MNVNNNELDLKDVTINFDEIKEKIGQINAQIEETNKKLDLESKINLIKDDIENSKDELLNFKLKLLEGDIDFINENSKNIEHIKNVNNMIGKLNDSISGEDKDNNEINEETDDVNKASEVEKLHELLIEISKTISLVPFSCTLGYENCKTSLETFNVEINNLNKIMKEMKIINAKLNEIIVAKYDSNNNIDKICASIKELIDKYIIKNIDGINNDNIINEINDKINEINDKIKIFNDKAQTGGKKKTKRNKNRKLKRRKTIKNKSKM